MRLLILLAATAAIAGQTVAAQQWNDAIQFNETNVRAPIAPLVLSNPAYAGFSGFSQTPTTDIYVVGAAESCVGTPGPTFAGSPRPGFPSLFPANCASSGNAYIDLNQFARQNDITSLQQQFASMMQSTNQALNAAMVRADQGIAMSLAMAGVPELQPDEHMAVSGNWGTFNGQNGGAVAATYRISEHASFNGGFAGSFGGGNYGGRAGIRFGW